MEDIKEITDSMNQPLNIGEQVDEEDLLNELNELYVTEIGENKNTEGKVNVEIPNYEIEYVSDDEKELRKLEREMKGWKVVN